MAVQETSSERIPYFYLEEPEKSPLEPENVGGNPGEDRAGRNHLLLYMK